MVRVAAGVRPNIREIVAGTLRPRDQMRPWGVEGAGGLVGGNSGSGNILVSSDWIKDPNSESRIRGFTSAASNQTRRIAVGTAAIREVRGRSLPFESGKVGSSTKRT